MKKIINRGSETSEIPRIDLGISESVPTRVSQEKRRGRERTEKQFAKVMGKNLEI